jgi:hypothetical protein
MLDLQRFETIAGVRCEYSGQGGTRGTPGIRALAPRFLAQMERAIEGVVARVGALEAIVSQGAYVPRPATPGDRHATGTAFDLCGLRFARAVPLDAAAAATDVRYLAVEAILRCNIPQVLDFWYNAAHNDHWHCDDRTAAVGFSSRSPADVCYWQACLAYLWDEPLEIDGVWGPVTRGATGRALAGTGLSLRDGGWGPVLDLVAGRAMDAWAAPGRSS